MAAGVAVLSSGPDELTKIQSKATKVTDESVSKTRDMLHLVNECKDAGVNTLQELYDQGDQLTRTEAILDETEEHLNKAQTRINNIDTAQKIPCCCLPCLSCFQKDPDRDYRRRRRRSSMFQSKLKKNGTPEVSTVMPPRSHHSGISNTEDRFFPKVLGTEDEDEIERNLGHVSTHLTHLKGIALDMGTEVTRQNEQLDIVNDKAEKSIVKLDEATKTTADLVDGGGTKNTCCCCTIC